MIAIDDVSLSYSPRELWQNGTVIRRVVVTRPRIVAAQDARRPLGSWRAGQARRAPAGAHRAAPCDRDPVDRAGRRERDAARSRSSSGPRTSRTEFRSLNASLSFAYAPVKWTLVFDHASWIGHAPDLTVTSLSGSFGRSADGWFFDSSPSRRRAPRSRSAERSSSAIARRSSTSRCRPHRLRSRNGPGVLTGLKNIAVEADFDTTLKGPLTALDTRIGARRNRRLGQRPADAQHQGAGLARHRRGGRAEHQPRAVAESADRPSDITGHVVFDLDLDLGQTISPRHVRIRRPACDVHELRGRRSPRAGPAGRR